MTLPSEAGQLVTYALVNDAATLLYLVNQGTLTFHPWLSRVQNLDRPDSVIFDLIPGTATFADTVAVAKQLHAILEGEKSHPISKLAKLVYISWCRGPRPKATTQRGTGHGHC